MSRLGRAGVLIKIVDRLRQHLFRHCLTRGSVPRELDRKVNCWSISYFDNRCDRLSFDTPFLLTRDETLVAGCGRLGKAFCSLTSRCGSRVCLIVAHAEVNRFTVVSFHIRHRRVRAYAVLFK